MSDENTNMKECPFCAEDVKFHAKKCKHCGETIDVALRAAEEAKRASENRSNVFMTSGGGGGGGGGGGASSSASAAAAESKDNQILKKDFPHGWHFFGTVITAGAWSIVWLLHYLFRDRYLYN